MTKVNKFKEKIIGSRVEKNNIQNLEALLKKMHLTQQLTVHGLNVGTNNKSHNN